MEYVCRVCLHLRGRATERQDQLLPLVQRVAEGSEELRLSLCRMVGRLLVALMDRGTVGILRPYLDDTILLLVSQSRDPYSTVTVEALSIIMKLVVHPHLEQVRCSVASRLNCCKLVCSDLKNNPQRMIHAPTHAGNEILRGGSFSSNSTTSPTQVSFIPLFKLPVSSLSTALGNSANTTFSRRKNPVTPGDTSKRRHLSTMSHLG